MRLLRCHIDNFGKFQDYEVDFAENPRVFKEPNGWGKSTLAAFVKVMFYGFANEKKRGDALERERYRYKPWQGGIYGGELEFEAGGKRYLLNRTFGNKEAEDTFALYDAFSRLKCDDFGPEIGEELFQIDQESFLRTIYIVQNDCDTAATDGINAKIGNLADCLGDMNNYEKVQRTLKDLRNSLTPARKTGSLKRQREEIAGMRDELRRMAAASEAVSDLEKKLSECLKERARIVDGRKADQSEWEALAARKALAAKRLHYESILRQCEEKRRAVQDGLASLGGNVPEAETLRRMQERRGEMIRQESLVAANAPSDSERENLTRLRALFAGGLPDEADLRRGRECLNRLEELRADAAKHGLSGEELREYEELKSRFDRQSGYPEERAAKVDEELEEGLRRWNRYMEKENGLGAKRATLSAIRALEQSAENVGREKSADRRRGGRTGKGGLWPAVLVAAILFAAMGALFWRLGQPMAGNAFLCAGGTLALIAGAGSLRGRGNSREEERDVSQEKSPRGDGAAALEAEIARDEERMAQDGAYVADLFGKFGVELADYGEDARLAHDELYRLKNDWWRFRRFQAREKDYRNKGYEEEMRRVREEALGILKPYRGEDAACGGRLAELYAKLLQDRETFLALDAKEKRRERARESAEELGAQIGRFLADHGQDTAVNADEGLRDVARRLSDYESDLKNWESLKGELRDFEQSHDVGELTAPTGEDAESEELLKARMARADERMSELLERIHAYRGQLDERQQELDDLQGLRDRLSELEAAYEADYAYYTNLGVTAEYLEKAKESLSARYVDPMLKSFRRNYEFLTEESGEDFGMDANLHVTRRSMGEWREPRAFSAGSRDLVNILLRVALVEAMYQGEKPFLILDDSFVNLDEERMRTAGKFLRKIAEEYQVIYFTCHESRTP